MWEKLIFSPMNAVKDMRNGQNSAYYDGIKTAEMRLQNAATSTLLPTPKYGTVVAPTASEGRVEHVALGGIKGRGFYLYPQTRIDYEIESGTDLTNKEWLISLFLDPREVPQHIRRLITLPSGAYVDLHGVRKARLCGSSGGCTVIDLVKTMVPGAWTHLAFHLIPGTGSPTVRVYQDGFPSHVVAGTAGFTIEQGWLRLGARHEDDMSNTTEGAEGWIDEFKVVEGPFSPEEVCNHARGTLVAVPHDFVSTAPACFTPPCLKDLLAPFAAEALGQELIHAALYGDEAKVESTSDEYVCHIDYTSHLGVSLADAGDDAARPLRRRLLFPEGPLYWDEPRPDSVANTFCLACHEDTTSVAGLKTAALTLDANTVAENDPRRQPMQPPKHMLGLIPAGYFGDFKPLTSHDGATQSIDRYIDDGPLFRWTFNEAAGTTVSNWVLGRPGSSRGDATLMNDASFVPGVAKAAGTARGHALAFDGNGDHAKVTTTFDIEGDELTLGGWFKLGSGASGHCQPYVGGFFPCTSWPNRASGRTRCGRSACTMMP